MKLEVVVPEKFMGDVTGMINSKRGAIEAMGERGQVRVITAKVPLSELFGFTTQLRSLSEGRGVPNLEFSHYAVVPRNVQDDIIASRK
jgi:elongation factor G